MLINSRAVISPRNTITHKSTRTLCGFQPMSPLPPLDKERDGTSNDQQHCLHVLYKSSGRSPIPLPMHTCHKTVELVHLIQHQHLSLLSSRLSEHNSGHIEQTILPEHEWELNDVVPQNIFQQWGNLSINVFTTSQNHK